MNLYLITGTARGYDTYAGAVVAAPDEDTARRTHPSDGSVQGAPDKRDHGFNSWGERWDHYEERPEKGYVMSGTWCDPAEVTAKLVGVAADGVEAGVVCASFRAG